MNAALLLLLAFTRPARSSSSASASASAQAAAVTQTKNYIDTIPGYAELSPCAVNVLSTIVRDENSGCQDTYRLTSYTCFCTDSSSFFSGAISSDVVAGCGGPALAGAQASSALGVFDAYCALGVAAGLTTQVCKSCGDFDLYVA
jgi:hypothetical protein